MRLKGKLAIITAAASGMGRAAAADLAHSQRAFENFAPMPWDHDLSATTRSYMWAHTTAKAGIPVYSLTRWRTSMPSLRTVNFGTERDC